MFVHMHLYIYLINVYLCVPVNAMACTWMTEDNLQNQFSLFFGIQIQYSDK